MNTNRKKLYGALIIYILSMAMLLVSRLFDFYITWFFIAVSIVMTAYSLIFREATVDKKHEKHEYNRRTVYSTLIFSSWLLVSIPLVLLGDYLAAVSGLGYNISFLYGGIADPLLWIAVLVSGLGCELFFRGIFYQCFEKILGKRNALLLTAMCFALLFLDIRLALPLFLLSIAQGAIGAIFKKFRYVFSLASPCVILIVLSFISGEKAGALYFGLSSIFGMLMIFSAISIGICYVIYKKYNEKRATYIEVMVIVIAIILMILLGSLVITL